ncbi:glycosyltransferase [Oscillatoria sp. FACHB-1407]|uniref:glycosyltransferase family 2 protein n=1 Tax=Oscillatoria sp. FACHB-1407 TaxID=2692847 RepID=UPI00168274EA|nr:glycosyltransferase [Oscillatoria sp. FACHB-1407]MBD2459764.1 glycosyltransferase [Oscillatoria sp. FACHB-1407]
MNYSKPRVSIGMPVYNGERFIKQALDSLLAQTFTDFELIISDNASTDGTEAICRKYAAKDSRIRYYRNLQNIGGTRNFNQAFHLARGEYFKWAAHDDVCEPTFLERCIEVLDKDPSIVLCHSKTVVIDHTNRHILNKMLDPARNLDSIKPSKRYHNILIKTFWSYEAFGLIRADVLRKTCLHGSYHGSDRVLLAELSLRGRFAEIPETLFLRRCHPNQGSSLKSKKARNSWLNPQNSIKALRLPILRGTIGYFGAIFKAPLTLQERVDALQVLSQYLFKSCKLKIQRIRRKSKKTYKDVQSSSVLQKQETVLVESQSDYVQVNPIQVNPAEVN